MQNFVKSRLYPFIRNGEGTVCKIHNVPLGEHAPIAEEQTEFRMRLRLRLRGRLQGEESHPVFDHQGPGMYAPPSLTPRAVTNELLNA